MLKTVVIFFIILLGLISIQPAFSSKIKIALSPFRNLSEKEKNDQIGKDFLHQLAIQLEQISSIQIENLSNMLIDEHGELKLSEKGYSSIDYLITGSYKSQKKSFLFQIKVVDVKKNKILDSLRIELSYPLKSGDYSEIEQLVDNVQWLVLAIPVQIETKPTGAEIYFNKHFLGRTPLKRVRAVKGEYQVVIYKKGYQQQTNKLVVKENQDNHFFYQLKVENFLENQSRINLKYVYPFLFENNLSVDHYFPLLFSYEVFFSHVSFEIETGLFNIHRRVALVNMPSMIDDKTISVLPISLAFKYHFFQDQWFSPYLGVGGGIAIINVAEKSSGRTNPFLFALAGINIGYIPLEKYSSRFGFFIESKFFSAGSVEVGNPSFNPYGIKIDDASKISLYGFILNVGISYIFY